MKLRIVVSLLMLAALLAWAPAAPAQEAKPETAKAARLSLDDILTLLAGGVTPARVTTLVKERSVDFQLTPENESKLRIAGADDSLLLAIAKAQPPPPKPEPEPSKPPPPPAPLDNARAALEKAIESLGGLAELESLRSFIATGRSTVATPSGEMTVAVKGYWLLPDKVRNEIQTPTGLLVVAWNGTQAWVAQEGVVQDLPPHQAENWRRGAARTLPLLLVEASRGQRRLQFVEPVLLEGHECDAIVVTDFQGDAVKLYVEKSTGHVLREETQILSDTGGVMQVVEMSYDFRPVGNSAMPFRVVSWHDGRKVRESVIESWQFNAFVDPGLFVRPASAPARKQSGRQRR